MMTRSNVLFVDDEANVHQALKRLLRDRRNEWDMQFMQDPQEAQTLLEDGDIDVAVLDLRMPGINGLDLARMVQSQDLSTKCIILTGCGDLDSALTSINDIGVFRYYLKPCDADELTLGIQDALIQKANENQHAEQNALSDTTMNMLNMGAFVVTEEGQLLYSNRNGADLLAKKIGLMVDSSGTLRAHRSEDSSKLLDSLQHVAITGETEALSILRDTDTSADLRMIIQKDDKASRGHILIFAKDPLEESCLSADLLEKLFKLTPAEARLTASLAEGMDLEEAASLSGITKSTARTYLKQIFGKLGVTRQAELVQTVLTTVAAL